MHWLDIVILVVLGIGAAMGFWTGLLWQVARAVSLAASLYLAILTNDTVSGWIGGQFKDLNQAVNRIIAFIAVFVLVYAILYLITRLIHQAIKASRLETLDRILGAVLGAAKMAAIMAFICAGMAALALPIFQEWLEKATIASHFAKGTHVVVGWIPQSYRDRVNEGVQEVRDQLGQKLVDAAKDAVKDDPPKK